MRKLLSVGVVVVAVLAIVAPRIADGPAQAASNTVVALTFDDSSSNQMAALPMLDAYGMKATFYVNSNRIDQPGWLTWADLLALQTDGQEIGGNTLDHVDINAPTTPTDAQTQVCEDRARLMKHGLSVTSFAYPFGDWYSTPALLTMLQTCGYNSARDQWGLYDTNTAVGHCPDGNGCGYPYASTLPLADPYKIPTATNVDDTTTLSELQGYVSRAEANGGGLVPFVFHQICDNNCDQYSTPPAVLQAFIKWLHDTGVTVQTMNQIIGGSVAASPGTADTTAPTSSIQCGLAPCDPAYAEGTVVPVSLSGVDEVSGSGLDAVRYTTDGSAPTISSPVYTTPFNVTWDTTVKFAAWDNAGNVESTNTQTILIADTTAPASTISCGGVACTGGWFNAAVHVSLAATDSGSGIKEIRYTTDGSPPTLSSPVYTAPFTLPASSTVQYFAVDKAGNAEAVNSQTIQLDNAAPTSAISCNGAACGSSWYHTAVQVSLSGSDTGGSGLAAIRYTTNGSDPTPSSATYAGPFSVSSPTTVKYRAYDVAGNAEPTNTHVVDADAIAPVSAITCNGGACSTGWYHAAVHVALSSADAGGSGVSAIHYTLDNTTPTSASPVYTAPLTLSASKWVKFGAIDNAGNSGAVTSTLVHIDDTKPVVAIKSPGNHAHVKGTVKVAIKASDSTSGIARIAFSIDGHRITGVASSSLSLKWNTAKVRKGRHTLTAKAVDVAGNSTTQTITVVVH